jgi:virulence factor Mce-like protein
MARKTGRRSAGMNPFRAGLIALVILVAATYFGFTGANPFANPYELEAVFRNANNLAPRSPVRIAGVEVGKVRKIEPMDNGAAKVTMDISEKGLPIHENATLKVRPRIFLEGNFFVELKPGSPSAKTVDSGDTIPMTQTSAPVQLGDVLSALQSDTREDLQVFLDEYGKSLRGGGAEAFNRSIKYWASAYRHTALANDATLGTEPTKDLQRVLKGQQKTFGALARDERSLQDLVTNFNVTAGALAREDVALEATLPALRGLLVRGQPALASLNDALPPLRAFARDALPGVVSSNPTLRASVPFITQLRRLVSEPELQRAARVLRQYMPDLVGLNRTSVPLFEQGRALSACTTKVLVPFANTDFPDPDFPGNSGTVNQKIQHQFVGLAGESRQADANQSYFHTSAVPLAPKVRPAAPTDGGSQPPPRRPDVPCETQQKPNLNAPGGSVLPGGAVLPLSASSRAIKAPSASTRRGALLDFKGLLNQAQDKIKLRQVKLLQRNLPDRKAAR